MFQPEHVESAAGAASEAAGTFNAGEVIIEHVSNSSIDHPLIHLPTLFGIDFSVTKHVFMLWVVATLVFLVVTISVRRYLRQDRLVPTGFMNALEIVVHNVTDWCANADTRIVRTSDSIRILRERPGKARSSSGVNRIGIW